MLIYHNVNFSGYQAQNMKVHVTGVQPASEQGQIYLDTNDSILKWHDGTIWRSLPTDYVSIGDNISTLVNDSGYLTSYTETDPVFLAHVAAGILNTDITNWNTAYGWGDHSTAGYITTFSEVDTLDSVALRGPVTAQSLTVGGLTITGNLTVSGAITTINSETVLFAANNLILNNNETGAATENAGIVIERGADTNRSLQWNESSNTWQIQKDDSVFYDIATVEATGQVYAHTFPDFSTGGVITHNFNTLDITVQMYNTFTGEVYYGDWTRTTSNSITVAFYEITKKAIRVLITKQV